jgi:hypothetical protein
MGEWRVLAFRQGKDFFRDDSRVAAVLLFRGLR